MVVNSANVMTEHPVEQVATTTLMPMTVAGLRRRVAISEISTFFRQAIRAVSGELARAGIHRAGPPTAIYRDGPDRRFEVTVGFPVTTAATVPGSLIVEELPGGPAVEALHTGSYEMLPQAYRALGRWFDAHRREPPRVMWEQYLVGPGSVEPAGYRTRVIYPLT